MRSHSNLRLPCLISRLMPPRGDVVLCRRKDEGVCREKNICREAEKPEFCLKVAARHGRSEGGALGGVESELQRRKHLQRSAKTAVEVQSGAKAREKQRWRVLRRGPPRRKPRWRKLPAPLRLLSSSAHRFIYNIS